MPATPARRHALVVERFGDCANAQPLITQLLDSAYSDLLQLVGFDRLAVLA